MNYYETAKLEREKGKRGENTGISMPISWIRMKSVLPNIQSKYYVILSDSGVGKSKLGHFMFMYNTFFQFLEGTIEDFEVFLYTAEMTVTEVIGEFHALYIKMKHGILTDMDEIYSYGDNEIPEEIDNILSSEEVKNITNQLEERVHIVNERINSGFLYKEIQRIARDNGTIHLNEHGHFVSYTKNNPNKWIVFIFDNFQKLSRTKAEKTLRESIVNTSAYFDIARLYFGFVSVAMQQVNRNNKSFDRYKYEQFFHKEEDLKDSEAPFHDAQIVISQISPFKLDLDTFDDYKVKGDLGLMDRLRAIKIIKNRGGKPYGVNYFLFLGECALYQEIPYPEDMTDDDYNKIKNNTYEGI